MEGESLTSAQVAGWLQKSKAYVQQAAAAGMIPAWKVGREWRFDPAELEAWKLRHHNLDPLTPSDLSRKRQATMRERPYRPSPKR